MNIEKIIKLIKTKKKIYLDSFALEIGVPIMETQRILNKLASKHGADIEADENGELIYTFDEKPSVDSKLSEFILLFGKAYIKIIWDILTSATKVIMLFVFISYSFVYFTFLTVGFLFTTIIFTFLDSLSNTREANEVNSVNTSNNYSNINMGEYFSDFVSMTFDALTLKSFHDGKYKEKIDRPFHHKIFSFIFGEDYYIEEINNEENILSFVRKHEKITLSDAINLTGLIEDDSQQLILSLLVKYEGEILVSDDAVIYYTFNEFDFRGVKNKKNSYIWQRKLPEYKLNENDGDDNAKIIIFGIINIILSSTVYYGAFDTSILANLDYYEYLKIWYGGISLISSIIFFILPLIRYPFTLIKNKNSERLNYIYYLFNDFSFHLERNNIDMNETDDEAEEYLFRNFPNIFKQDFVDNKNIINLNRYHEEIKFTSNNNPKNTKILNPDDTDFLDSFDNF